MSSVLLDANLLLLFLVGSHDPDRIGSYKRTARYTRRDFETLADFVVRFERQATTPHVLTEVSNLTGAFFGDDLEKIRLALALLASGMDEQHVAVDELVGQPEYVHLGLTDCAVLNAIADYVVTDGGALYAALLGRGARAVSLAELHSQEE